MSPPASYEQIMGALEDIRDRLISLIGEVSALTSSTASAHHRLDDIQAMPERVAMIEARCAERYPRAQVASNGRWAVLVQLLASATAIAVTVIALIK